MVCKNCGAQINEGDRFCGRCGSSMEPVPAPQLQPGMQPFAQPGMPSDIKKSGKKKISLIVLAAAVVCAAGLGIVIFCSFFLSSYKTPIRRAVKIVNNRETESEEVFKISGVEPIADYFYALMKLSDQLDLGELQDNFESLEDEIEETTDDLYDDFSDIYGDDWKITYEIKRIKELDKEKREDLQENFESTIESFTEIFEAAEDEVSKKDYDELMDFQEEWEEKTREKKVTKAYEVKVRLTIEGEDDKKSQTDEWLVYKVGREWMIGDEFFDALSDFRD